MSYTPKKRKAGLKHLESTDTAHVTSTKYRLCNHTNIPAHRVMLLVDAVDPMVILRLHVLFPARIPAVQHQLLRTTTEQAFTLTGSTVEQAAETGAP
jgi:uncharacterized protein (UPF0248 family)